MERKCDVDCKIIQSQEKEEAQVEDEKEQKDDDNFENDDDDVDGNDNNEQKLDEEQKSYQQDRRYERAIMHLVKHAEDFTNEWLREFSNALKVCTVFEMSVALEVTLKYVSHKEILIQFKKTLINLQLKKLRTQ